MDHSLTMNVDQSPSDTSQLEDGALVNRLVTAGLFAGDLQARPDPHLDVP